VDYKGRGYVVRMALSSITGFVNGSMGLDLGSPPSPYIVIDVDARPDFYKVTSNGYVECDDFTRGQATTYTRHFLLLHSTEEEAYSWVDKLMIFEGKLKAIASKTKWSAGEPMETLLPILLPDDPEHISYMTREELEAELMQHRRKKFRGSSQSPKIKGGTGSRGRHLPTARHGSDFDGVGSPRDDFGGTIDRV